MQVCLLAELVPPALEGAGVLRRLIRPHLLACPNLRGRLLLVQRDVSVCLLVHGDVEAPIVGDLDQVLVVSQPEGHELVGEEFDKKRTVIEQPVFDGKPAHVVFEVDRMRAFGEPQGVELSEALRSYVTVDVELPRRVDTDHARSVLAQHPLTCAAIDISRDSNESERLAFRPRELASHPRHATRAVKSLLAKWKERFPDAASVLKDGTVVSMPTG